MTRIHTRKPKNGSWQTAARFFDRGAHREICIALRPQTCELRLKGTRKSFQLPWGNIFQAAVMAHVLAERRAKMEAGRKSGSGKINSPRRRVKRGAFVIV